MKQWPAGVNSRRFAEVTENDILRTQDITTANDTAKKATKIGIKVFRDKQCFNTQFAHMSSVFCPDHQASPMRLSLSNNCPSTAPLIESHPSQLNFHWAKRFHSRKFECHYLSLKWLWFPTLQQQAHGMISEGNFTDCSFNFYFKLTAIAFAELLWGINDFNRSNFVRSALTDIVEDRQFLWNLQSWFSSFTKPPSLCKL